MTEKDQIESIYKFEITTKTDDRLGLEDPINGIDICYKYSDIYSIIPDSFDKLIDECEHSVNGTLNLPGTSDLPSFYAYLNDNSLLLNLIVRPKKCSNYNKILRRQLNTEYVISDNSLMFTKNQITINLPCAVFIDNEWKRGLITRLTEKEEVYVKLVDVGTERLTTVSNIRALLAKFGKIPPLSFNCSAYGVRYQDMNVEKTMQFQQYLKSIKCLVQIRLLTRKEPYQVSILHPTIHNKDVVEPFYSKFPIINDHVKKSAIEEEKEEENDIDHFDSDFEDEDEEDDEVVTYYIKSFGKPQKINCYNMTKLRIHRVDSASIIYLYSEEMLKTIDMIETCLTSLWPSFPLLESTSWKDPLTACAVNHKGTIKRASIINVDDEKVKLLLIDYATEIETNLSQLRLMTAEEILIKTPQIMLVSLKDNWNYHKSVADKLRNMLPEGERVKFIHNKKSKSFPSKGNIILDNDVDISYLVEQFLEQNKIDVDCTSLVVQDKNRDSNAIDIHYNYQMRPPVAYAKSKHEVSIII